MAYEDPWAWMHEQQQPKTTNTIPPLGSGSQEPTPSPQVVPQQQDPLTNTLVGIGATKGADYAITKGAEAFKASQAPLGATATPVAGSAGTADAVVGTPLGPLAAAPEAATTLGTTAAVDTTAAAAGTAAATEAAAAGTAAAGAGAAEAGTLAAMGPVGWGIGALLLAKQMDWI